MKNLLFLDLETTGLDERNGRILEIGAIVTNSALEEVAQFHEVVFSHPGQIQACFMPANVMDMHTKSGLLTDVINSTKTLFQIENEFIAFIKQHFLDEKPALYGNSIHFDKRWIDYHMPKAADSLHYRLRDISGLLGIMEETKNITIVRNKTIVHRSMDDCRMSIALLQSAMGHII